MSQQLFVTFKNTIQSDAKNSCSVVYLEKSFETVLVNVEEGEDVKVVLVHKQWVLTSQGPFILLPCLVVFPENGKWCFICLNKEVCDEIYSLKLRFQFLFVFPVLDIRVAVRVFANGQYFKHQNAVRPNIAPGNIKKGKEQQ